MRVWTRRYIGVVCLNVLLALGSGACSSSQEDQENLENSDEQGYQQQDQQDEEENQEQGQQDEQYQQGNENGNENFNAENMENDNLGENNLAENGGEQGNATENDLQEIISEMDQGNGQGNQMQVNDQQMANQQNAGGDQGMQQNAGDQMVDTSTSSAGGVIGGMAGQSAGQGLPELGSKMPYIVRAGDTLARISARIYGTSGRWREISALSGMDNPNTIYPGDVVYYQLSQEAVAFAQAYVNVSRQEIVVQQGDTLATISKRAFGSERHWKSIWRENDHIVNPDQLVVGQTVFYVTEAALTAAIDSVKENTKSVYLAQLDSNTKKDLSTIELADSESDFEFETLELTSFSELITLNIGPQTANTNSAVTSNS